MNPQTPQGLLNRLRASMVWASAPELNVTPSFLAKEMISLSFDGEATTSIDTGTGIVQSPNPYQKVILTMNLLKTQALADLYKARLESNCVLGDGTLRPDVTTGISPYEFSNCSIQTVGQLEFAGQDPKFPVMITGYYTINNALWDGS